MNKNPDGSVTLSKEEVQSLSKVVSACRSAISNLVSDGDFLGWDNYYALQMWDGKLQGKKYELTDYIDDGKTKGTIDEWLQKYGKQQEEL